MNQLPEEIEEGNIEYKLKIIPDNNSRLMSLSSQLRWRCNEGRGMAIYLLGISDKGRVLGITTDELDKSIHNLGIMIRENNYRILQQTISKIANKVWASIIIINDSYNNHLFINNLNDNLNS